MFSVFIQLIKMAAAGPAATRGKQRAALGHYGAERLLSHFIAMVAIIAVANKAETSRNINITEIDWKKNAVFLATH